MSASELVDITRYEQVFLGKCKGIALSRRGKNDPHVMFTVLTEDDGNWFASNGPTSLYWMMELQQQMNASVLWLRENADVSPDGYGWVFKEKS